MTTVETGGMGLYIHVPFCVKKCPYCDFYSLPAAEHLLDAYADAVCACLDELAGRYPYPTQTLYFGGGTPALLGAARIARLVERAAQRFGLHQAEITLEANPGWPGLPGLFAGLGGAGVNRLSLGLQSALPAELALLGRRHTPEDARHAVEGARAAGISNISLDLMLGIPRQTAATLRESIQFCASLGVEHISSYLLKIEPGTPFAQGADQPDSPLLACPDEDGQADLYLQAVETLHACGYLQYEISNFSRPGFESRHNLLYWDGRPYLGVGPAAHGFIDGLRYGFPRDLNAFVAAAQAGNTLSLLQPEEESPNLPPGSFAEYVMLRLRLTEGLVFSQTFARFPHAPLAQIIALARPLQQHGLLQIEPDSLSLTPCGFLLSNAILSKLLLD